MLSTTRHVRRSLCSTARKRAQSTAMKREERRMEKFLPENPMDHPEIMEKHLQVMNLQERGKGGDPFVDTNFQNSVLTDLSLTNPWIPLWPPQLAPGDSFVARIAATWNEFTSNMRARREWFSSQSGLDSYLKSTQAMYLLAQEKAFYRAPSYPPWATLPASALAPSLDPSLSLLPIPPSPSSIKDSSGSFIPLSHYSSAEPNTRYRDPYTAVGKQIDVFLFNGKYPISPQLFGWGSSKSNWTLTEREKGKKKKEKGKWIEGFRWSCMESYLKHLHAFSTGDIQTLRQYTSDTFSHNLSTLLRSRYRQNLKTSPSRFYSSKKPGWNEPSHPPEKLTYKWTFHGPYNGTGAEGKGSGIVIRSIRAREVWSSVLNPPVGNRLIAQALVSFDTIQSLQMFSNDKLVKEEGPRRVREDYVMEKKMFQAVPWAIMCKNWDRSGFVEPKLAPEF